VTSSVPGEGKSMIACNLALALAETGQRVLLVDADLRRPMVATYSGLVGEAGLTSVLVGRADFADVVQRWGSGGPDVLTSGPIPPNPSELLSSRAMSALLDRLLTEYDVVVLDTPPLIAVADGAILGRQVDGAIVVVDRTRTRRQQLVQAVDSLQKSGVAVLGVVLNRVHAQKNRDVYYSTPKAPPRRFRVPTRSPAAETPVAAQPGAVDPVARVDRTSPEAESEQPAPDRTGRPAEHVAYGPGQSGAAPSNGPDHGAGRPQTFGTHPTDSDEVQGASTGPVSTAS
jgi:succinoglycan biosynthesis transport protein ExoP